MPLLLSWIHQPCCKAIRRHWRRDNLGLLSREWNRRVNCTRQTGRQIECTGPTSNQKQFAFLSIDLLIERRGWDVVSCTKVSTLSPTEYRGMEKHCDSRSWVSYAMSYVEHLRWPLIPRWKFVRFCTVPVVDCQWQRSLVCAFQPRNGGVHVNAEKNGQEQPGPLVCMMDVALVGWHKDGTALLIKYHCMQCCLLILGGADDFLFLFWRIRVATDFSFYFVLPQRNALSFFFSPRRNKFLVRGTCLFFFCWDCMVIVVSF